MTYPPQGHNHQRQPSTPVPPELFDPRKLTTVTVFWVGCAAAILVTITLLGDLFPTSIRIASAGRVSDLDVVQIPTGSLLITGWIITAIFALMLLGGVLRRVPGTGKGQLLQLIVIILGAVLVPGFSPVVVAAFIAGEYVSTVAAEMIYALSFFLVLPSVIFSLLAIRKPKNQQK